MTYRGEGPRLARGRIMHPETKVALPYAHKYGCDLRSMRLILDGRDPEKIDPDALQVLVNAHFRDKEKYDNRPKAANGRFIKPTASNPIRKPKRKKK